MFKKNQQFNPPESGGLFYYYKRRCHIMYLKLVAHDQPDIYQQYYNYLLNDDKKPSANAYLSDNRRFTQWITARHNAFAVQSISALDIVEYRTYLIDKQLSPATINRSLNAIKSFFKFAYNTGLIHSNPAADIKFIKIAKPTAPKWLTRPEQAALIRAVKESENLRDEAVITLLLHTGLRVDELTKLKVTDVIINPRGGHVKVMGKGNKYRDVPLNATARKILARWLETQPEEYLFPGQKGRLTNRAVRDIIYKHAYVSKLEDVSPHTLRHTFCKNLLDMGVPLTEVSAIAGHATLNTTQIYTTPSADDIQKSVEKTAWE